MTALELKAFREALGMTQEEFGRKLGFKKPVQQVSMFENEKRPISRRLEVAVKLWKENLKLRRNHTR